MPDDSDETIEKVLNSPEILWEMMEELWEKFGIYFIIFFASIGIFSVEFIYYNTATEVRLLFIIILLPFGAFMGGILLLLIIGIIYLTIKIAKAAIFLTLAGVTFSVIFGIIYLLYETIIARN